MNWSPNYESWSMSDKVNTMEWLDPKDHEPPLGKKVLLLTRNGVAIIGVWMADALNKAWCPLPSNNIFGGSSAN